MRNRRKIAVIVILFLLFPFLIGMGCVSASNTSSTNDASEESMTFSLPDILGDSYPDDWVPDDHTMIQNMLVSWSNQIYGANAVDGIVNVVSKNPVNMDIWNN